MMLHDTLNHPHGLAAALCNLPCTRSFQVNSYMNVEGHIHSSCSIDGKLAPTLSIDNVSDCTSKCCNKHLMNSCS